MNATTPQPRFHWQHLLALGCIAYATFTTYDDRLRIEQMLIVAAVVFMAYAGERTRALLTAFLPLLLAGVVYDSMRFYSAALGHRMHVEDVFRLERTLFRIRMADDMPTPNEFLDRYHARWLDLVCAGVYLLCLWVPASFMLILHKYREQRRLRYFAWSFFALSMLGFITYFVYPAAPPWYVSKYGFAAPETVVEGDPACLARCDLRLGVPVFTWWYTRAPEVLCSLPALNVAYAMLTLCFTFDVSGTMARRMFWYVLAINFAAVYLNQHYVLDIALGNAYAVAVYNVARWLMKRFEPAVRVFPHPAPRYP